MSRNIHKGTELNNVRETWEQNERHHVNSPSAPEESMDRLIEEEAAEYDHADKKERLLGGERATVHDDENDKD